MNFLKQKVLEMIPKVFDSNPDATEVVTDEIIRLVADVLQQHILRNLGR